MRELTVGMVLLSVLASCSSETTSGQPNLADSTDEYLYDCERAPPSVTTYATDEAYRELVDVVSAVGFMTNDRQSTTVVTPAAGTPLSASKPPTISFTTDAGKLPSAQDAVHTTGGRKARAHRPSLWSRLWDGLAPIGTAWAHCPAASGDLVLVLLSPEETGAAVYSALVSVSAFSPRSDIWRTKLGPLVGQRVRLTLARAVYSTGKIQLGPFVSSTSPVFLVGE